MTDKADDLLRVLIHVTGRVAVGRMTCGNR